MNNKLLLFAMSCLLAFSSIAQVKHFDVQVGDFNSLNVVDNINVVYESDTARAGTIVFDCMQQIADGMLFSNNGHGRLSIQLSPEVMGTPNLPTLHVYSRELAFAENSGDSTMIIKNPRCQRILKVILSDNGHVNLTDIEVSELELKLITGKGLITASGYSHKLMAQVLGKGTIDATAVSAQEINCRMTGTGTINVDAEGAELKVRGTGTGRINYEGTPSNVKVRKLGPLKVNQIER